MIEITRERIDLPAMTASVLGDCDGAVVSFLGTVRNQARGKDVLRLEYHGYEPMALRVLQQIAQEMELKWPVRASIVHRLGMLEIGEVSVAIVVASPHRAAAFEACRHAIERVKADAPIWKKEHYCDGAVWIEDEHDKACCE